MLTDLTLGVGQEPDHSVAGRDAQLQPGHREAGLHSGQVHPLLTLDRWVQRHSLLLQSLSGLTSPSTSVGLPLQPGQAEGPP